jgi:hypothetical protein
MNDKVGGTYSKDWALKDYDVDIKVLGRDCWTTFVNV